jgi:glycosyltransferase involved in cell wall biosynthesis
MAGGPQKSGEEAYLAGLKSLADRAGIADRVRFLGQRRDVPRLMAAADIHCQPNTGPEPFGIVFVEALYSGLPVVTVAMGGAAEIVDGTCGIAVPTPGTPAAVADALARLVGDPELRRRLGSAGPVRAAELCDPDRQAGRLAEAIRPLIRSGRAAG